MVEVNPSGGSNSELAGGEVTEQSGAAGEAGARDRLDS
jgi:hypothetical protein